MPLSSSYCALWSKRTSHSALPIGPQPTACRWLSNLGISLSNDCLYRSVAAAKVCFEGQPASPQRARLARWLLAFVITPCCRHPTRGGDGRQSAHFGIRQLGISGAALAEVRTACCAAAYWLDGLAAPRLRFFQGPPIRI